MPATVSRNAWRSTVSALIDSGDRQVVLVVRGEGRLSRARCESGLCGDSWVEITEGIKAGDGVVVLANFLIDAESNLKAALSASPRSCRGP